MKEISDELRAWLTKRGIEDGAVIADLYSDHDSAEGTRALFPIDDLEPNQLVDLAKKIRWLEAVGGFHIHRREPSRFAAAYEAFWGTFSPPLTPQLKSWKDPLTRKRVGYHGEPTDEPIANPLYDPKENPKARRFLHSVQIQTPHQARAHIAGRWHRGVNSQTVDIEQDVKKYDFLAAPRVSKTRAHTHRRMYEENPQKLLNHLCKRHALSNRQFGLAVPNELPKVPGIDEPHPVRFSKKLKGDAARIDFQRLAEERLPYAKLLYFQYEGSSKAAAMLCAIRRDGTQETVISVPSVSMNDPEELLRFLTLYPETRKMRWMICVDADGCLPGKEQVMNHAWDGQDLLEEQAIEADIILPDPQEWLQWYAAGQDPDKTPKVKAVDDLLGNGGSLDDIIVMGRREPLFGLAEWVNKHKSPSYTNRSDGIFRDARVLAYLAKRAAPNGDMRVPPLRTIQRRLGWKDHKRVARALISLTWGDPKVGGGKSARAVDLVSGSYDIRRNHFSGEYEWKDAPVINVHPELRAAIGEPSRLGNLRAGLRNAPEERTEDSRQAVRVLAR
jgi:hypothetical protein